MAPFAVAAIVAASLFGTGTVIKDKEPVVGTVLQGAAIGTLAGGALGGVHGFTAGTAKVLGTKGVAHTTAASGLIGGGLGAVVGGWFSTDKK